MEVKTMCLAGVLKNKDFFSGIPLNIQWFRQLQASS